MLAFSTHGAEDRTHLSVLTRHVYFQSQFIGESRRQTNKRTLAQEKTKNTTLNRREEVGKIAVGDVAHAAGL